MKIQKLGGINYKGSSVSSELDNVSSLVVSSAGRSSFGIKVTLDSQSSAGLTSGGNSSKFSMFLMGAGNPVNSGIITNGVVRRIGKDNLKVFVCSVLGNPVGVKNSQTSEGSADSFLSFRSKVSGRLELVDTDRSRLSGDDTLGNRSLSSSSSDADSVDDVALLGLVSKFAGLVRARGSVDSGDDWKLSVLPSPHSEDEVHEIRLFLSPKFLKVLVGSHMVKKIL